MLVIGKEQLETLQQAMIAREREALVDRFAYWWRQHGDLLGRSERRTLDSLATKYGDEANSSGIADEERLFTYLAARSLMPDMTGEQYLHTLDIIFDVATTSAKIQALRRTAITSSQ